MIAEAGFVSVAHLSVELCVLSAQATSHCRACSRFLSVGHTHGFHHENGRAPRLLSGKFRLL